MVVVRKRLIFWLIKAYIKKSGKTMILSFLLGLIIFFGVLFSSKYFIHLIPFSKKQTIGIVGAYTQDNLPANIVNKLSLGLTTVSPSGTIQPGLAATWNITSDGKIYTFHLKPDQHFNNGTLVTSQTINYNFSDVSEERPDNNTIVFKLKNAYAPFLVTVSRPIFEQGLVGVGEYNLSKFQLNGNFMQSLSLIGAHDRQDVINYEFYPTEESLKTAFKLGEVTQVDGLTGIVSNDLNLKNFPNTRITNKGDYTQLITLFYKNDDPVLSDKRVRLALTYALPDKFTQGKRAYLPYPPTSVYYNNDEVDVYKQDFAHAKLLLLPDQNASGSGEKAPTTLTLKILPQYRPTAEAIAAAWKNLGITTKIVEVDTIPYDYQVFLGDFSLPGDPDQYTLWHSDQKDNITHYKNLRIDKLLEDGRKIDDIKQRKSIYANFQKYLLEDAPAAFLYFPDMYTIVRK
ncbi:MAG: ABC transporter substrate-binding protein [Candidatus Levyibacteriota bacterium]